MNNESYVLKKEQCPECRKEGNDKSHDNLAVYSDGHSYCFRCGYSTRRKYITQTDNRTTNNIILPADVTTELTIEARQWLGKYSLPQMELINNHIMWSNKYSRIIFPYFDDTGLIAWQGRYIGKDTKQAKWFSQGKIHEIIHAIKVKNRSAVLVEDIISAIKVSQFTGSIPIFGSSISTKQILRLKTIVDKVWYWLDPDMRSKSVKMASTSRLYGLESHVIFSEKDPKDHNDIADILRKAKATP